jgi:hypothetical protein
MSTSGNPCPAVGMFVGVGPATAPIQIGSGDRSINYQSFDYAGTAAALPQLDADTRQCRAGASVSRHRNGGRAPATNRRPDQDPCPGHHRRCSRRRRVAVSAGAAREHCRRGPLEFCDRSVRLYWMRFPWMSASRSGLSWRCRDNSASRRGPECSTSNGLLDREQCHRLPWSHPTAFDAFDEPVPPRCLSYGPKQVQPARSAWRCHPAGQALEVCWQQEQSHQLPTSRPIEPEYSASTACRDQSGAPERRAPPAPVEPGSGPQQLAAAAVSSVRAVSGEAALPGVPCAPAQPALG